MGETSRRLAGILAADVVGFSAKVGADEPGTLARVGALRTDVAEPLAGTHSGRLEMPVVFLHAAYDYTCETLVSRLAEPMRQDCGDLAEVVVSSGHWVAQGKPVAVNAALAKWLADKLPALWPG